MNSNFKSNLLPLFSIIVLFFMVGGCGSKEENSLVGSWYSIKDLDYIEIYFDDSIYHLLSNRYGINNTSYYIHDDSVFRPDGFWFRVIDLQEKYYVAGYHPERDTFYRLGLDYQVDKESLEHNFYYRAVDSLFSDEINIADLNFTGSWNARVVNLSGLDRVFGLPSSVYDEEYYETHLPMEFEIVFKSDSSFLAKSELNKITVGKYQLSYDSLLLKLQYESMYGFKITHAKKNQLLLNLNRFYSYRIFNDTTEVRTVNNAELYLKRMN